MEICGHSRCCQSIHMYVGQVLLTFSSDSLPLHPTRNPLQNSLQLTSYGKFWLHAPSPHLLIGTIVGHENMPNNLKVPQTLSPGYLQQPFYSLAYPVNGFSLFPYFLNHLLMNILQPCICLEKPNTQ